MQGPAHDEDHQGGDPVRIEGPGGRALHYQEVGLTEINATACLLGVLLGRYATLSGTTVALVQVDGEIMQELTTAAPKDTRSLN